MNAVAVAVQHGLLERDEALACLLGAHAEARAGTGQLVLVSGEAGIGKTSLVHAFAATLGPSTRVLEGRCDGLFTPRPLSPFADIARATNGAFAAALERGGAPEVFDVLLDLLAWGDTILVVEDVHWADEATLDVLRLLGRRVDALGALAVVTYRDDGLDRRTDSARGARRRRTRGKVSGASARLSSSERRRAGAPARMRPARRTHPRRALRRARRPRRARCRAGARSPGSPSPRSPRRGCSPSSSAASRP